MNRHLLILTALHHEAAAIDKGLKRVNDLKNQYQIEIIGPAASRLSQLQKLPVSGIIMAGLAGGLDPQLKCGDVLIDELSQFGDGDPTIRKGKFHTSPKIVTTAREKCELFRATGAAIVEMESAAARRLAAEWSVPYLGIRAVLDSADEELDPALLRLTDPFGRVRRRVLLSELCRRPGFLQTLLRMRSQSAIALQALCSALAQTSPLAVLKRRGDKI